MGNEMYSCGAIIAVCSVMLALYEATRCLSITALIYGPWPCKDQAEFQLLCGIVELNL